MQSIDDGFGSRIPRVTLEDVRRIVARDYPETSREAAWAELKRYTSNDTVRVQLAALKCANGNLKTLAKQIDAALEDYRDLLVAAEYPTPVSAQNWHQYESWFDRK
jgi:hypothetical protein